MVTDNRTVAPALSRRIFLHRMVRRETIIGWLFVLPALLMYAAFVLVPLLMTILYSFFRWNGVGPATWIGLKNYVTVFQSPNLFGTIINAFLLVVYLLSSNQGSWVQGRGPRRVRKYSGRLFLPAPGQTGAIDRGEVNKKCATTRRCTLLTPS